ncbi:hypothetical protein AURDEDRAFT_185843 [Auricularia subglabra TFB-10046 SS5]|nr:hypothetical protein AURDEDRAFT_185843 [Auricularia subglabra TFB-10046 SS5]
MSAHMPDSVPAARVTLSPRDLVAVLPTELASEVFWQLNFVGRLSVSHVCRSWRNAALADRRLWSTYTAIVTDASDDACMNKAAAVLAVLLARSDPLPFRLKCEGILKDALGELVMAHMGRMEVLQLGEFQTVAASQRLLAVDAPMLRHFSSCGFPNYTWVLDVPAEWATRLEHLDLGPPFVWPTACVFRSLHTLYGRIPEGGSFGGSILHCFPILQRLSLCAVTQAALDSMTPLPHSLTTLTLHPTTDVDCARLLNSCDTPGLCYVNIWRVGTASSVQEAFRLFAHTIRGSWRLHATSDTAELRSGRHRYKLDCAAVPDWLSRVPGVAACWAQLRELHLRLPDFLGFLAALSRGIALPALAVAGFVTKSRGELDSAAPLRTASDLLDAPRLQSLTLTLGAGFDSASAAAVFWRVMAAFRGSAPLAKLILVTRTPAAFCDSEDRFRELSGRARQVEISDFDGRIHCVFV